MMRPVMLALVFVLACGDDDGLLLDASADVAADTDDSADVSAQDARRDYEPEPFTVSPETEAYCRGEDSAAIEARITDALSILSRAEKVALISGVNVLAQDGAYQVAGNEALGFPGLRMLDGPRGLSRVSLKTGTAFPVAMMRGATWDTELESRVGAAMAREIQSAGANVLLAPTLNILRHPRWGRAQETYSEDTHHMAEMGVAFVQGVQSEGVLASAKHYAANSIENTRHSVNVELDERTLREIYLPHFRRVVQEARVASVMTAYNQVRGQFCDLNGYLLTDILKGEWAFQGFVESDWILGTHGSSESIRVGLDVEMPFAAYFASLESEIEEGILREQEIDRAVRRVLRAQLCFGLDRQEPADDPSRRETPEHVALAREVALRGAVLLKNAEVGPARALPIEDGASIVLVGALASLDNIGDTGSSSVMPRDVVTVAEGMEAGGFTVSRADSINEDNEGQVAGADVVVVVVGLTADDEGEATIGAGDRESLSLSDEDEALIAQAASLNDLVVVILNGGAAIVVESWIDSVEAVVFAFYPGQEGGHALADLFSGRANFSGRLPFSVPVSEAELPPFDNTSDVVSYGFLHGYRFLDANDTPARFPFGYGLSYGAVRYDSLELGSVEVAADETLEVRVRLTNEGDSSVIETVQLYVASAASSVIRAPQDLRAFTQLSLEPGASGEALLRVPLSRVAFWDEEESAWVVEPTEYEVRVGPHAASTPLRATFAVVEK